MVRLSDFDAILFDFDGTIVDSNSIKRSAFYEVAERTFGSVDYVDQALSDPLLKDRFDVFGFLKSKHERNGHPDTISTAESLSDSYSEVCEERIMLTAYIDGVIAFLDRLKSEEKLLFVSSATPEVALRKIVQRKNIHHYFEKVLGRPDTKVEHIAYVTGLYGCPPARLLYIGDSEDDQASAEAAGCEFIGIGDGPERFLVEPVRLMKNYENTQLSRFIDLRR